MSVPSGSAPKAPAFAPGGDPLSPGFRVPALAPDTVQLWLLARGGAEARWRALLAAHAGTAPDALPLARGAHGKPELSGSALRFSLSTAGELVLLALSRGHELGVDVESLGRRVARPEGLLERCFGPAERAAIAAAPEPGHALLEAWCAKEAVVKGIGRGIAFGLTRVELEGASASVPAAGVRERWWLWSLRPSPGYVGALACRERALRVEAYAAT